VSPSRTWWFAESTPQTSRKLFEFQDLRAKDLKGIAGPARLGGAAGEFGGERLRGDATAMTPLVGRNEAMELLMRRWPQARTSDGQIVLISAEHGWQVAHH
jgi:hypothetical protein